MKGDDPLPDITADVLAALKAVLSTVHYQHPAHLAVFPCAVLYQSGGGVAAQADGSPHLCEIEYTLEVWAASPAETHTLSALADEALNGLGLRRTACTDLFDPAARAHRRVLRYRALCDADGVLTQ